ncbi:MAG: PAS domain S-box protein [Fidelibacterota bacterium]
MQKIKFQNIAKTTKNKLLIIYSIIFTIAIGIIFLIYFAQSNKLKRQILEKVKLAAVSIDIDKLNHLSTTPDVILSPTYKEIKKQLIKLKKEISNCEYLYILHKKDNQFYFLINAVPLDVETSQPEIIGEPYHNIHPEYDLALKNRMPKTFGPISDEYGKTIVSIVPLHQEDSRYLFAADITANDWYRRLFIILIHPVIGIILISFALVIYLSMKIKFIAIVDRKNEELIQSEKMLFSTFQSVGDGLITTDINGKVNYINDAGIKLLKPAKAIIGRPLPEVFNFAKDNAIIFHLLTRKRTVINDVKFSKDGHTHIFSFSSAVIKHENSVTGHVITFKDTSESYQLKQDLIRSEKQIKSIIQNSPLFLATFESDGHITFLNGNILQKMGIEKDLFLGKSIFDLFDKDDKTIKQFKLALKGEENSFTTQYKELYLKVNFSPFLHSGNHFSSVLCVGYDITENIETEKSLRESEETFRALTENSPDIIMRFNPSLEHLYTNQSVERYTGIPRHKFFGNKHSDLDFPEDISRKWEQKLQEVFDSGKISRMEFYLNNTWFDWIIIPEFDDHGNVKAVITSARDITSIKRSARELEFLQSYLSDIIDSMPSILIGINVDGQINLWNKAIEKLTGKQSDEVLNKHANDVIREFNLDLDLIRSSIEEHREKWIQKEEIIINNRIYFMKIIIYPLSLDDSKSAIIRMDDITDQIRMEELLIQSEKMLSLGGLAAGMAHEINNPIAGMVQNCDVLINRLIKKLPKNESVAREYNLNFNDMLKYMEKRNVIRTLQMIKQSGRKAADIVKNMLDFARKDSGTKAGYRLSDILEESIKLIANDFRLKDKYDFKKIRIERDYPEEECTVFCDKGQIQQVLLNILKNGAEAMSETKSQDPRFNIKIINTDTAIIIKIANNGPKIPDDKKKYIFDPFYTTKSPDKGTGLGLSISYFIIVQNHGGEIYIEDDAKEGTEFVIKLPINKDLK